MINNAIIGTPGKPWGETDIEQWRDRQTVKRSYEAQVLGPLADLAEDFVAQEYGQLSYADRRYPLMGLTTANWQDQQPTILITGGVHGYETSGVQGAIRFMREHAARYSHDFNFAVAPCISPWGYETINRWNPQAIDPNRAFVQNSASDEAALVMAWVASLPGQIVAHFDLHETTDTDNSVFRPALGARDGIELALWAIPDGFYAVGDTRSPAPEFQRAVIASVAQVTHIAPTDDNGCIIGVPIEQHGVINYDVVGLGLCAGMTTAPFRTTTEVYPDSPKVDDENCILAQVAAVCGGIDFLMQQNNPLR